MQEDSIKQIQINADFSDVVFKTAREERFGITFCCPLDLDKISIKKELCDWQGIKLPVYTKKEYAFEEWIFGGGTVLPSWGTKDCFVDPATGECLEDNECVLFEVVNQDGTPIEGYPIILDGGNAGLSDEYGYLRVTIPNASVDVDHTVDLCYCFETTGNCSQIKITITLTEECPAEACSTPTKVCPSTE